MKFGLWTAYGALNSKSVFEAFAKGASKLGHNVIVNKEADIEVIWSILWHGRMARNKLIWNRNRKENKPIIVLEVGCFNRGVYWKMGINGINKDAFFGPTGNDHQRADKLKLYLQNNHDPNGNILIAGQHKKSGQWSDENFSENYYNTTINEIRKFTDKKIIFRPHPRSPIKIDISQYKNIIIQNPQKIQNTYDNYNLNFKNLYAVINWSSNPGVLAAIEGIPTFVGPSSLAYDVSNHDLSEICQPKIFDRTQWMNDVAYTEWSIDEISSGCPLKRLISSL